MKEKIIITIMILIIAAGLFGCTNINKNTDDDGKITVAVSVVPGAAFVKAVAGDLVNTVTVIPKGYSPANYLPTTLEMQALSDADIYFVMQMPAEDANILPKVSDFNEDIILVNLRDAVSKEYPLMYVDGHSHGDEDEHEDHEEEGKNEDEDEHEDEMTVDPHIWLSPKRVIVIVQTIADELSAMDSENESVYRANAKEYIEKLVELDIEIGNIIADSNSRAFMIYHGSYGYFADDYGLEMISLEADGKAATAAKMQTVIDMANEMGITAIFYQDEFDDNQAKTIAEEIDGVVKRAAPLSENYIEELENFAKALTMSGDN